MKKVLIIVFAVLLAISGGLFAYGVSQGTQQEYHKESKGLLAAPDAEYIKTGADHWYTPTEIMQNKTQAEKVANLLVYTSYNHINCKQFYFEADMRMNAGNNEVISKYFRAVQGVNYFHNACAYTPAGGNATRRAEYVNQRMDTKGLVGTKYVSATYNKDTDDFSYTMPGKVKKQTLSLAGETPYNIYSWYDFLLDLGGEKSAQDDPQPGRTAGVDASLIGDVQITEPTTDVPYYTLTFSADLEKTNASAESLYRLNESLAGQIDLKKEVDLQQLSFIVEIWECGLFRSMTMDCRMTATVNGDKGIAEMKKTWKFSYDDVDCSVAYLLRTAIGKWENLLSDENKAQCAKEIEALNLKEE